MFGFGKKRLSGDVVELDVAGDETRGSSRLRSELVPAPCEVLQDLKEYTKLAKEVGFIPPDLAIEAFKAFLSQRDIPVFKLANVVRYMDDKARTESKDGLGWEWRPLREIDATLLHNAEFGTPSVDNSFRPTMSAGVAASDYYCGPRSVSVRMSGMGITIPAHMAPASSQPYNRPVPLHALRKVALIERSQFKGTVAFMVCDYALKPHIINPDPFLMVVVPNPKLNIGEGRFVIDFWDEPGFGVDDMIA